MDALPGWTAEAKCLGTDVAIFYDAPPYYTAARMLCASCPVRRDCLEDGLTQMESYGVWGGSTKTERRSVRHLPVETAAEVLDQRLYTKVGRSLGVTWVPLSESLEMTG